MDTAADALIRAQLADIGLAWLDKISWNAPAAVLYQNAIARGEGIVAEGGGGGVRITINLGSAPEDARTIEADTTEVTDVAAIESGQ